MFGLGRSAKMKRVKRASQAGEFDQVRSTMKIEEKRENRRKERKKEMEGRSEGEGGERRSGASSSADAPDWGKAVWLAPD